MSVVTPGKELKDWTYEELQTYLEGEVLKNLIAGKLSHGVWICINMTEAWLKHQQEKK